MTEEQAAEMSFSDQAGFMGMSRWCDPMYKGVVPESMKEVLSEEDMQTIYQPLDLFTVNVYGAMNFYAQPGRKHFR